MKKEDKIFEWLMHNNELYEELNKVTSNKLIKNSLKEKQDAEVKLALTNRGSWSNSVFPVFSGEVCYLENSSFITKENIEQSRQHVKEWMFKHVFTVEKDGIVFKNECKSESYSHLISGLEYEHIYVHIPELPSSFYSDKEHKRNCNIRLIKDCGVYSDLLFRPNAYSISYDLQNIFNVVIYKKEEEPIKYKPIKPDSKSLINENGVLRYKIKECQDLYLDMQNIYCYPTVVMKSFKNFPDIVHGNFVIIDWDNINSFEGFPSICEKEVVFKNCRIPFNADLPEGITINENLVCLDCSNDYNILIGILKYNWNIKGKIYTSLYTGTLEGLREIALKENWI